MASYYNAENHNKTAILHCVKVLVYEDQNKEGIK